MLPQSVDYHVRRCLRFLLVPPWLPLASEIGEVGLKLDEIPDQLLARRAASKLRILDPACGSGSFLLGAYQRLLDWHLDYYTSHSPQKYARGKQPVLVQVRANEWRLSTFERKRILQGNIYGVDIDEQAVEVTKLNLLLKCLEGATEQTLMQQLQIFHEPALLTILEQASVTARVGY